VLPLFKRAEHNERGADAFHGTGGPLNVMDLRSPNPFLPSFIEAGRQAGYRINPDFNGADQEGIGTYQVTHRNGERFSAAKAYLTPHLQRPNLQVITGAHATRILFDGTRAVGVEYRQGGAIKQVRAGREVLLSAGALLSPQLLMLSGIGPAGELRYPSYNSHDSGTATRRAARCRRTRRSPSRASSSGRSRSTARSRASTPRGARA